jgi:hypothetical protein
MRQRLVPFRVPVFSLASLEEEPTRHLLVYARDAFDAYLKASDKMDVPSEFTDEDKIAEVLEHWK